MQTRNPRARWARLVFLIPFIAVLWVPFYNRVEPMWAGIPFFYWYQLIWIPLTAIIISAVYWFELAARTRYRSEDRP